MHRNSQKRFYDEMSTYFITTNTKDGSSYFKEDIFCELFVENLRLCKKLKDFEIYAFVIIPAHVHLLIYPYEKYNISKIMQSLKRHFSRDMKYLFVPERVDSPHPEGEIRESRLQGVGVEHRQQTVGDVENRLKGGEYEQYKEVIQEHQEKVKKLKQKYIQKYGHNQDIFPPFKWQKSFHDHVIRGDKDFQYHYEYIINNPEKHGLVKNFEDYRWQSLNPEFDDFMDHA